VVRLQVGTSGYNYDAWRGTFYPEKLAKSKMLGHYATVFSTVEINYTFYRLPSEKILRSWLLQVPPSFRFALKAPQRITHHKRLKECDELVSLFFETVRVLGDALGPILFQLPPQMKKDLPRLEAFLRLLPADRQTAFEFRDASWFDEKVFTMLAAHGAALCVADSEDLSTPLIKTAPFGYLRLRREDYTSTDLESWASKVKDARFEGEVFVFFKHEDSAQGPVFAREFRAPFQNRM
jgi:uncharacterized protein YecE (DUF72 family)